MNQYFHRYGKGLRGFYLSLIIYILFFPSITSASNGDIYFCEDINFSIYENDNFRTIDNYRFFLKWSGAHTSVKYDGEENWRQADNIVFEDKDSFLAWEIDPVDGSGISTSTLNEKDPYNILHHRTHQDNGFISSIISKCYKQ